MIFTVIRILICLHSIKVFQCFFFSHRKVLLNVVNLGNCPVWLLPCAFVYHEIAKISHPFILFLNIEPLLHELTIKIEFYCSIVKFLCVGFVSDLQKFHLGFKKIFKHPLRVSFRVIQKQTKWGQFNKSVEPFRNYLTYKGILLLEGLKPYGVYKFFLVLVLYHHIKHFF